MITLQINHEAGGLEIVYFKQIIKFIRRKGWLYKNCDFKQILLINKTPYKDFLSCSIFPKTIRIKEMFSIIIIADG